MCTENRPGAYIVRLYVAMHDPLRVAEVQGLRTTSHALFNTRALALLQY